MTIEHVALLNVKPDADSTKVASIIDEINGLASLGLADHLSVSKLIRCTSTSLNFSHIVHCRFSSTDDLAAYNHHPEHLHVAQDIQPIIDDAMILDWVSNDVSEPLKAGCVVRVTLLKLKDENEKGKFLEVIQGVQTSQRLSVGENLSHEMSKGYSMGLIAVLPDLEASHSDSELAKSNLKDFIDSELVVDYLQN